MKFHGIVVAAVMLVPAIAFSQSIEEKQKRAKAEAGVADFVKQMNKTCKTTLPEKDVIDWATWPQAESDSGKGDETAKSRCSYVMYGTKSLCGDDKIAQETVAKDIKKFVCKGDGKDDVSFEVTKDGTLVAHTNFNVKDTDKKAKKWLSKNLQ